MEVFKMVIPEHNRPIPWLIWGLISTCVGYLFLKINGIVITPQVKGGAFCIFALFMFNVIALMWVHNRHFLLMLKLDILTRENNNDRKQNNLNRIEKFKNKYDEKFRLIPITIIVITFLVAVSFLIFGLIFSLKEPKGQQVETEKLLFLSNIVFLKIFV